MIQNSSPAYFILLYLSYLSYLPTYPTCYTYVKYVNNAGAPPTTASWIKTSGYFLIWLFCCVDIRLVQNIRQRHQNVILNLLFKTFSMHKTAVWTKYIKNSKHLSVKADKYMRNTFKHIVI